MRQAHALLRRRPQDFGLSLLPCAPQLLRQVAQRVRAHRYRGLPPQHVHHFRQAIAALCPALPMERRGLLAKEGNALRAAPVQGNQCVLSNPLLEERLHRVRQVPAAHRVDHLSNAGGQCLQARVPALALPAVQACFRLFWKKCRQGPSPESRFTHASRHSVNGQ